MFEFELSTSYFVLMTQIFSHSNSKRNSNVGYPILIYRFTYFSFLKKIIVPETNKYSLSGNLFQQSACVEENI